MQFNTASISRQGGRKENQDYCSYLELGGYGCYLLADGLGGHKGGGLAAEIIGQSILESFKSSPGASLDLMKLNLESARHALIKEKDNNRKLSNMKATLVILMTDFKQAIWGHIGDSRLYFFRKEKLFFQTKDHSVPQYLADSGEISHDLIRYHEDRNRLTQSFDGSKMDKFDYYGNPLALQPGDAFLICSDGFWEYVVESEMENDLSSSMNPEQWLSLLEQRLLEKIKPDHDNYSALSIMVESDF